MLVNSGVLAPSWSRHAHFPFQGHTMHPLSTRGGHHAHLVHPPESIVCAGRADNLQRERCWKSLVNRLIQGQIAGLSFFLSSGCWSQSRGGRSGWALSWVWVTMLGLPCEGAYSDWMVDFWTINRGIGRGRVSRQVSFLCCLLVQVQMAL